MKNWNKPEVEELDVRCTEGGGTFSWQEYWDDNDPACWDLGKS